MTNRLAKTRSLYLRKHADNPIDWWTWCNEALLMAQTEDKPIFLSIGYSSCHWCTVMEGEAFSDLAIAEYMNANFIPIKVDREERPDIDSIYMQSLQMMTGQGGWPLNAFLSPDDLVPFYAGTYFPVAPRYGRPGFLEVLQAIRHYYDHQQEDFRQRKASILEALLSSTVLQNHDLDQFAHSQFHRFLKQGWETAIGVITPKQMGNSFPMIPYCQLVLQGTRFNYPSANDGLQMATQRGLDLALGGIYDHVGGGFHRYTVDATWTVPHFEKMLYDNGQIVEYLANLWSAGVEEPAFKRAVAGTVSWLEREMISPTGYFYAAQDADSFNCSTDMEPEEGAFYVWSYRELQELLSDQELLEVKEHFSLSLEGNFEGKNVLQRLSAGELSSSLELILGRLFLCRYGQTAETLTIFPPARNNHEAKTNPWHGRIPPVTDTKMIVAWNSLMISGLARASEVFQQPSYLQLAVQATRFILDHQFVDGRFHRLNYDGEPTVLAQSEDYALFIKALLDLHQADSGSSNWLEQAIALQDEFNEFLLSVELGGYFNTSSDNSQDLIIRERNFVDNATPSANGVAIANLIKLSLLTDNLYYLDLAESALKAFSTIIEKSPQSCPSLLIAIDWYRNSTLVRSSIDNIKILAGKYLPTTIFDVISKLPGNTIGLVCQGLKCLPAPANFNELLAQVQRSHNRLS
ncbi:thioredoxin domain-containing protein [Cylindrospermopsis raciborskii S07]|uniref:thioredoxin domain-containing protein n=1 Tax=Cylindrospermopsis raciborskii TaxID=77022 RepID=UPI000C9EB650|nr:thioredoxin domain-containing protein [Cylindrospermopsis raciborskii]PNK04109.1 thioredoxin domain-containing protein [Cylindrospermopsis raciborskii S07]PNK04410.1 thioredoxin domain-containing protein [Cylindrospermopsis raciborskii S14]PNK08623.1 thioredoxin domain-containing protein [Cylindrospermopsis raciborskii S10]PNK12034.1 thioredoxin domain-containing protein [Cylindrospermopsis raciborskii S05]PNK15172.1 thioredoxin domain-containing protein [Cylindrospermopsis raciborskii S06]